MPRQESGFTLIELLIVIAIILVIAAMAIPSLMRSKMSANEVSAANSLRTMTTTSTTYYSTYGNGYPASLGAMGGPAGATIATCDQPLMLDSVLSNNGSGNISLKSGYRFNYVPGTSIGAPSPGCSVAGVNTYQITAVPVVEGSTGVRGFFVDTGGVIRYTMDGSAPTGASPPIQ